MKFKFKDASRVPADKFEEVVPADFHPLYEQQGDEFVLGQSFARVASAVDGLGASLEKARRDGKAGRVDLSALSEWGTEPEAIAEAVREQIRTAEERVGTSKKDALDALRKELGSRHEAALSAERARAEAAEASLRGEVLGNRLSAAVAEAGGFPELLLPVLAQRARVAREVEGGPFVVQFLDESGEVQHNPVTGAPVTAGEVLADLAKKEVYRGAFRAQAGPGGGTPPRAAGGAAPRGRAEPDSPVGKIQSALERGQQGGQKEWGTHR